MIAIVVNSLGRQWMKLGEGCRFLMPLVVAEIITGVALDADAAVIQMQQAAVFSLRSILPRC